METRELNGAKLKEAQEYWSKIDNLNDFIKSMLDVYEEKIYVSPWHVIPFDDWDISQKIYKTYIQYMISSGLYAAIHQPSVIGTKFRSRAFIEGPMELSLLRPFISKILNINSNIIVICSARLKFPELKSEKLNKSEIEKVPKFKYSKEENIKTYTIEENKHVNAIMYYKPSTVESKLENYVPAICRETNSIHLTEISRDDKVLVPTRYWLSINSNVNLNYITNLTLLRTLQSRTTWVHIIDQKWGSNMVFRCTKIALEQIAQDKKEQLENEQTKKIQLNKIKQEELEKRKQLKEEQEKENRKKEEIISYKEKSINLWKNRRF